MNFLKYCIPLRIPDDGQSPNTQ